MEPPTGPNPKESVPNGAEHLERGDTTAPFSRAFRVVEEIGADPFSYVLKVTAGHGSKFRIARRVHRELVETKAARTQLRERLLKLAGRKNAYLPGIQAVIEDDFMTGPEGRGTELVPEHAGKHLYVLEAFPAGRSLRTILDERKLTETPLEPEELAPIVAALIATVDFIDTPLRHGCLMPEHVYIEERDDDPPRVVVTAPFLGAAIPAHSVAQALEKDSPAVAFFAPELRKGEPHASSDLYSVGAIAFEALTGRTPQAGEMPRRELGQLADAIGALLKEDPEERAGDLDPMAKALGIDEISITRENDASELLGQDVGDDLHDLDEPSAVTLSEPDAEVFDARATQVDVDAVKRFKLTPMDLKATQLDTDVQLAVERDTEQTNLSEDPELSDADPDTGSTPTPAGSTSSAPPTAPSTPTLSASPLDADVVPQVQFSDLNPSLVKLALGADPAGDDESVATTPGTTESPGSDEVTAETRSKLDEPTPETPPSKEQLQQSAQAENDDQEEPLNSDELYLLSDRTEEPTAELLSSPLPTPEPQNLIEHGQVPEEAEATVEQHSHRRPETMARTMVDVRTGIGPRRTKMMLFFSTIGLVVVLVLGVAAWVRDVRLRYLGEQEERRLERKLERLGGGSPSRVDPGPGETKTQPPSMTGEGEPKTP